MIKSAPGWLSIVQAWTPPLLLEFYRIPPGIRGDNPSPPSRKPLFQFFVARGLRARRKQYAAMSRRGTGLNDHSQPLRSRRTDSFASQTEEKKQPPKLFQGKYGVYNGMTWEKLKAFLQKKFPASKYPGLEFNETRVRHNPASDLSQRVTRLANHLRAVTGRRPLGLRNPCPPYKGERPPILCTTKHAVLRGTSVLCTELLHTTSSHVMSNLVSSFANPPSFRRTRLSC